MVSAFGWKLQRARHGETSTVLAPTRPLSALPYALDGEDADADPTNELTQMI